METALRAIVARVVDPVPEGEGNKKSPLRPNVGKDGVSNSFHDVLTVAVAIANYRRKKAYVKHTNLMTVQIIEDEVLNLKTSNLEDALKHLRSILDWRRNEPVKEIPGDVTFSIGKKKRLTIRLAYAEEALVAA